LSLICYWSTSPRCSRFGFTPCADCSLSTARLWLSKRVVFLLFALWLLSAWLNDLYDPKKIIDLPSAWSGILRTIALVMIAYIIICFFLATPGSTPRALVSYQGVVSFLLIGVWRVLYVLLIQRPGFARKVIVVGAGWAAQTIVAAIQRYASAHC